MIRRYSKLFYFKKLLALTCVVSCVSGAGAAVAVMDSFEINSDPPAWQNVSQSTQSHNSSTGSNGTTPLFSTLHATHGTQAGEFITTWTLPGVAAAGNPHVSGDPLLFWSSRMNA